MPYHIMSVQYIAGFFDGEGSVGTTPKGAFRWTVAQKGKRGLLVMNEMGGYLLCYHGIHTRRYKAYRQDMHTLGITMREDVLKACRLLLPYLHIKKTEVQDLLRLNTMFPKMVTGHPAAILRHREAMETRRGSSGY